MYAVFVTGGKQYRVSQGDKLRVEKLSGEPGASVEFEQVLMVAKSDDDHVIGKPYVDGGKVTATVKAQGRGEKIEIVKMRRRKNYRRKTGHRQAYTELEITGISAG